MINAAEPGAKSDRSRRGSRPLCKESQETLMFGSGFESLDQQITGSRRNERRFEEEDSKGALAE